MRAALLCAALIASLLPTFAWAEELEGLERAIDEHPDDAKAYDAYALAAFKQKRFDDAIKRLKVGVARLSDYTEGYYKLAYAYRQKREWADAADYYRRYIALNPSKTDPYFGLGAALEGLGDKRGAISAYEKYVSLERSPAKQSFVRQAEGELAKLDPSRAVALPHDAPPAVAPTPARSGLEVPAPSRTSADAVALRGAADQLRKEGRLDEAATAYQRAIDADRSNLDLYNDLGNVYFALKKYGEAARAFEEATKRDQGYALGWYNLAHALRKADKKEGAVKAYRQYMRLRPEDPDPYYGLGQTLKALGDVTGAVAAFRQYIDMEKRPDEQRWVDKARAELEMLEAMQKSVPSPKGGAPSGRLEEPDGGPDRTRGAIPDRLARELERDNVLPLPAELHDPFANDPPVSASSRAHDLKDPFSPTLDDAGVALSRVRPSQRKLAEYGVALAAYRQALARHIEEVTLRYEMGVAFALANDTRSAEKLWNQVALADPSLDNARRSVERLRAAIASRR